MENKCLYQKRHVMGIFLLFTVMVYVLLWFELLPNLQRVAYDVNQKTSIHGIDTPKDQLLSKLIAQVIPGADKMTMSDDHINAVQSILNRQEFCLGWIDEQFDCDSWWTHHPDWSVSKQNATHYCYAPIRDTEKAAFMKKLYQNQFQNDCSHVYTRSMWSSGWGADFRNVNGALLHGVNTMHRPVQMYHKLGWHYAATRNWDRPVCPSKDMYCYFLNLTNCPPDVINKSENFRLPIFNGHPGAWVAEYAIRPQKWLRKAVYEYARDAVPGLAQVKQRGEKCATLHVRRSDVTLRKENGNRVYYTIPEYFEASKATTGKDLPQNILLLTDDEDAVEEAQREFPNHNWMMMNRTRFRGSSGGWENQIPSGDPKVEVIVILATFQLIQHCNILVHARSSFSEYMWGVLEEQLGSNNTTRVDLRKYLHAKQDKDGLTNKSTTNKPSNP